MRTGHYVRSALAEPIAVTERGKLIAILHSPTAAQVIIKPFPNRSVRDLIPLRSPHTDSTSMISEDRDRA